MRFHPVLWCLSLISLFVLSGCTSSEVKSRQAAARAEAQSLSSNPHAEAVYRIVPGDGLRVDFLSDPELTRGVTVRPDGFISLPLIEDVKVAGKPVPEVRRALADAYKGILKKPIVSVSVESYGAKVFVGGEVANPGIFVLYDGTTALQAIMMAGGARNTAGLGSVLVIRDEGKPEPKYLMVDLKAQTADLKGSEDVRLQPKDVVLVPKSRVAKADLFVEQYMNQILPFQKSASVSYIFGRPSY